MTTTELLAQFANPETLKALSLSNKLLAGLVTTVLGIGITFAALIILQFLISWMDRLVNRSSKDKKAATPAPEVIIAPEARNQVDDGELVAVISATLAMQMKTSVNNIVIRNIRKIEDRSPLWNRAGIIEQMNSRL